MDKPRHFSYTLRNRNTQEIGHNIFYLHNNIKTYHYINQMKHKKIPQIIEFYSIIFWQ